MKVMNFGQWTYSGQGHLVERELRRNSSHLLLSLSHQPLARRPHWLNSIIIWKAQEPWREPQNSLWELEAGSQWGVDLQANRRVSAQGLQTQWGLWAIPIHRVCASCCGGCRLLTPKYKKKTWKQNINAYLNISRKQNIISSSLIITF